MNTNIIYASRKRRKPVQKAVKPFPVEGTKSNPSKRHRDRLNTELDRLAGLLPFPQDVISRLDKLSVLRLSVSYLRAKGFFEVALKSSKLDGNGTHDNSRKSKPGEILHLQEGELLLQALNGFVLVITSEGLVFYASSTIQDYLGFQQSDVIHQSVFELIHTEDRAEFQCQLHWALNPSQNTDPGQISQGDDGFSQTVSYYNPDQLPPENSSFMERSFICRLRCLLDNSSGFLAMNFQGRLKFLHGQNKKGKDGSVIPPQLALFAFASPLQSPSILEIRTKNFIFRTKHKLDFTPIGCDAKGKLVLGYTEAELCMRGTGYQFIHAGDMLYCAENHVRMIKTGESGMTVFRLLTKENGWTWVQANARLIYKNGRPDYIIATQRPLSEEEGTENLRKRNMQLPFMFTTGEAVLYEVTFPIAGLMASSQTKGKGAATKATQSQGSVDPSSLLGAMLKQDESVYICPPALNKFSFENFFNETRNERSNIISTDLQDNLAALGNNTMKQEQTEVPLDTNPSVQQDSAGLLVDHKNSELSNIMRSLGIDFEDIELIHQDEGFFRNEFDYPDIGDIDVAEEIFTYVQDFLNNRSDCMYSNVLQQQPTVQDSSCIAQVLEQQKLDQNCPNQVVPQQLCQKMSHMQVNSMLGNWNTIGGMPLTYQQPHPEEHNLSGLHTTTQELSFSPKDNTAPYAYQNKFMPYQPPATMVMPISNHTQMDFQEGCAAVKSKYPELSNLEGFLNCLQKVPVNQPYGVNSHPVMQTPQTYYTGAVSMYQYMPETQSACLNQAQYEPLVPDQQPLINKFQSGFHGSINGDYLSRIHDINSTQSTPYLQPPHLQHPTETRSYPDVSSSGFV
ncbi:aryl hydrocarbon receptor isoform X2 [Microcaecilia unicolor]|uniref:Aryl hydrocarbon receptor n=1 Tax=Microcaecilia unicolor TaxID=1415580 RepID=A0A6P7XXS5_9AMPH|nr:aryl hydrocarbon receptor isoform X2 [Microcaecilia unicolor]